MKHGVSVVWREAGMGGVCARKKDGEGWEMGGGEGRGAEVRLRPQEGQRRQGMGRCKEEGG